jgi:hypothetical protein
MIVTQRPSDLEMAQRIITLLVCEPTIRQHVLAHHPLLVPLTQHAEELSGLDCTTVQQQLAAYLDAEQLGVADQAIYQRLALHVQYCPSCFELHHNASDISAAQAAGALPIWPQPSASPAPAA